MKRILKTYLLFIILTFFISTNIIAKDIVQPMSPPRLVNDFTGMLNASENQKLEKKLLDYNDTTSTQIYIVIIDSLNEYSIDDYALQVGRNWGIGQKKTNNGILILISKSDRKIDIEIGYGLESFVTDYDSKHIIDELIKPSFKQNYYYDGLEAATNKLISLLQSTDYSAVSELTKGERTISVFGVILLLIFVIFLMIKFPIATRIAFILLSSAGGRGGSGRGFGGGGGGSFGGGGSSGSW